MLMEKAWAKLHGNYARIIAGSAQKTLRDLTGAPTYLYWTDNENIWEMINEAD